MKNWQEFTATQSAKLQSEDYICDAAELGLILVTGDDAESFLQNQLSNDIGHIDENHYQLSAYSTAKGRMLAIFHVVRISNGFILVTAASLVEALLQRLQMFVIQSQVSLADASGHFARFALQTDKKPVIQHVLLPQNAGEVLQNDSLISIQLGTLDHRKRYLLLCLAVDEAKTLWNEFAKELPVGSFDSWRLSQITAGIPAIYPATSEEFVLQMTNLDLLDGVSFKKGCYPGQEIIARMHYLGKLKRRLFLTRFKTDHCPKPGDDIVSQGAESPDGSGKVIDAVIDDAGLCHCLYVAQIKKALNNDLRLFDQSMVQVKSVAMPYRVPEV